MSDLLMREVEEELRQEQMKKLWDRYGVLAIIGVVLVVAGVGGYRFYGSWQASQAAEAGDKYLAAVEAADTDDASSARASLTELIDSSPGDYQTLARLRLAGVDAAEGNRDAAVAALDAVADDTSVDAPLRSAASIRAAYLLIDVAKYEVVLERLQNIAEIGNPWRHSARDALALSAYRNEKWPETRQWLDAIISDPSTPPNLTARVQLLSAIVDSKIAPDEDAAADENAADDAESN
ncbi:MAG: tetratricopeptide repeat protein [Pseudomonadota bacterium]